MSVKDAIWVSYFNVERKPELSLQLQLRQAIVRGILDRRLSLGSSLPSTRHLSGLLGIGRNTVLSAYNLLVQDWFLLTVPRRGHIVNPDFNLAASSVRKIGTDVKGARPDWPRRVLRRQRNATAINRPSDWQDYPFPFVHGQIDRSLFPARDWRETILATCSVKSSSIWASDMSEEDDPLFIEQIRNRLLPRRGIWASNDQILVTLGAQHALFLVAHVLFNKNTVVGLEDICYPDVRNIFSDSEVQFVDFTLDEHGLLPTQRLETCDYLYVA